MSVYGKLVRHDDHAFMPADVRLDGSLFSLDYRLGDHFGVRVPPSLRYSIERGFDAAWVRARIPNLFGFTPEPAEVEKALLHVGFVAVSGGGTVSYPFICTDHYGKSALMFSDAGPEQAVKRSIADSFWGVLAQNPDDLADFEQRVHHPGAMMWLEYGCESGRVYCEESGK